MTTEKKNRYLQAEEGNFLNLTDSENSITFATAIIAVSLAGYWLTLQAMEVYKMPDSAPFLVALLAPVLFVAGISGLAKIKTVKDIEEEVQEAIDMATEAQAKAAESIEKAEAYDRLKEDNDRLQKIIDRSKQDNDRLWADYRALQEKLTTVQTSATTVFEEAEKQKQQIQKEYLLQLNDVKTEYFKLENRLLAIEEAIKIEGEVGSLNGRAAKATGDEKEAIDRDKGLQRAKMVEHLKKNTFLLTLKTSWAGMKI